MRSHADFNAQGAQSVSTRAWLYLGALAVGFLLASVADLDAMPAGADAPSLTSGDAVAISEATPRSATAADQRNALRPVAIETTPRVTARQVSP